MTTVELFAGIGGFRLAAESTSLRTLWANDICPKACAVYRSRFGSAQLREGDLLAHAADIPAHDLLTAGFPCQPFSSAGKKRGIRDPRGTLFQVVVDVLKSRQPRYFVLENVKRLLTMEHGLHFATILSSLAELDYQIEWRLLNALHFGLPQNRQRVFIVGVQRTSKRGLDLPHIRLANCEDLFGREVDGLSDPESWKPIEQHGKRFPTWGLASASRFLAANLDRFSCASPLVPLRTVLETVVPEEFDFTETTQEWVSKNTPVNRFVQGVEILSNQAGGARMGYTIFGVNGVAPTLTSTTSRHYERYKINDQYRRLTNVEYARIQGFPDDHCAVCSVYDQYALFGNAVPLPMAEWVIRQLLSEGLPPSEHRAINTQRSLFDYAHESATAGRSATEAHGHHQSGQLGLVRPGR
jgi:DNA (cytosine-5)-methyltransferase 1